MKHYLLLTCVLLAATVSVPQFTTHAGNDFADKFAYGERIRDDDASGVYTFDKAHTFINFRVRHLGLIDVPGYFRDFTGTINYDAKDVTKSTVEFTAKTASVDTGVAERDAHLRTADFFDVENYPEMTFKSTKVEKKLKVLTVTGDLTIRGVTKSISFPFQIAGFLPDGKGAIKMGLTAETSVNRKDFGVNFGTKLPTGVPVIADVIKINLQVEANRPPPTQPAPTPAAGG